VALDGSDYMGIGTHLKYYIEEGEIFNDITPIRATTVQVMLLLVQQMVQQS
jgi:hypothetical protein